MLEGFFGHGVWHRGWCLSTRFELVVPFRGRGVASDISRFGGGMGALWNCFFGGRLVPLWSAFGGAVLHPGPRWNGCIFWCFSLVEVGLFGKLGTINCERTIMYIF